MTVLPALFMLYLACGGVGAVLLPSLTPTFTASNATLMLDQDRGPRLVLNQTWPAFTMLPNSTCNSSTTCPDFLAAGMGDIIEVGSTGAPLPGRGSGSVLNVSAASWSVANQTAGVPAVTVTVANFTIPYASAIPACPQPSSNVPSNTTIPGPGGAVVLQAMVPLQDTNLTVDGQTVEVLAGNVKWNARVMNWPFCNSSDSLQISFLMRSANDSSPPTNDTSTDLLDVQKQLEERFNMPFNSTYAVNVTNTSMMGAGPRFGRRGLGMQGGPNGTGGRGGFPGGFPEGGFPGGGFPGRGFPLPRRPIDAFNQSMFPPFVQKLLNQTFMQQRPVFGMGHRNLSHPGMFLFFPVNNLTGKATLQVKVDIPAIAIINGVVTNVTLTSPRVGFGHDHKVDITIPAAPSIVYDPTATLSTPQTTVMSAINSALTTSPANVTSPPPSSSSPPPQSSPPPPPSSALSVSPTTWINYLACIAALAALFQVGAI